MCWLSDTSHIAEYHENATILFADTVSFTSLANSLQATQVVAFLNDIFSRFDDSLLEKYVGLNKIKIMGDCYMVTDVPQSTDENDQSSQSRCAAVCHFALDMIEALRDYNESQLKKTTHQNHPIQLNMRIGINTGPVVAGVVGTKRFYTIYGAML